MSAGYSFVSVKSSTRQKTTQETSTFPKKERTLIKIESAKNHTKPTTRILLLTMRCTYEFQKHLMHKNAPATSMWLRRYACVRAATANLHRLFPARTWGRDGKRHMRAFGTNWSLCGCGVPGPRPDLKWRTCRVLRDASSGGGVTLGCDWSLHLRVAWEHLL